jgi:signal transduction histidine kinase
MSLLIVLIAAAILVATYVVRVRQAVEDGATARIRGTTDATEEMLASLFNGASNQLRIACSWGESGLLEMDGRGDWLEAMFAPVLERNPSLAAATVADSSGRAWSLGEDEERRGDAGYDPRTETWFQGALGALSRAGLFWTLPYAAGATREPRMTASTRCDLDGDGEPEGVIAFDVRLTPISDYTTALYVGGRGRLVVITDDGAVVGLPGGVAGAFMMPAQELPVPELATAVDVWMTELQRRGQFFRFESGDEHWWGGVRYYGMGANRRLAIAVVVPEADFRAQADVWRNAIILITLGALGVAVLMASVLARRYGRPLVALATASRWMRLKAERRDTDGLSTAAAEDDTAGSRAIKSSGIREIDALAEDFMEMATKVENKSRQLEEYSHTLEQRVEERTEDLNKKNIELLEILAELQETQQQLILQEKMASLGNLVAGVAHEVNNPIGAVNSAASATTLCIQKMRAALDSGADPRTSPEFQKVLKTLVASNEVILEGGRRVGELVKSLKNFSRLDEADEQRADVHEGIESTLKLADHLFRNRVEVIRDFGDVPRIMCYPNQLNQVFMNLLANAAQAIKGQGRITIKTRADEDNAHITVSDTGVGVAPDKLDQIFDPGFTTKGVGVGMGLGLPISHRIIDKHSGTIRAESEPGVGTSIHITLPIRGKDA